MKRKKAFTLIELIIVVVIIAILAAVAIPRYYASVTKTQKNTIYYNLELIREAVLGYYAVNNAYPADSTFPIVATVDGDAIINLGNPSGSWTYGYPCGASLTCASYYASNVTYCYCVSLQSGKIDTSTGCCARQYYQ